MDEWYGREQQIKALEARSLAAGREWQDFVSFYEVWKPAVQDQQLLRRLDETLAGNAFVTIRAALQRELIMSIMRIWDDHDSTICLRKIMILLDDHRTLGAIVHRVIDKTFEGQHTDHAARHEDMLKGYQASVAICQKIIRKYKAGERLEFFKRLGQLRDEHLAHRQVIREKLPTGTDDMPLFEEFANDTGTLVADLLNIIHNRLIDRALPLLARQNAKLFWASVRGETDPRHPDYHRKRAEPWEEP